MPLPPHIANEIARLMRDPDALRHERERISPSGRRSYYNPNQPRVPAGNSDGGQWMDAGPGSGLSTREQPQMGHALLTGTRLADVLVRHLPIEFVQGKAKGGRRPNPFEFADAARLALYNELSVRNGADQQTIVEFRAAQYRRDTLDITQVAVLSRDEFGNRCPLLGKVQSLTNEATDEVRSSGGSLSPQQFGTAVHTLLKQKIIEFDHQDLKGEVSFLKGKEEGYGIKDTVRIDVLEKVNHNTVCIHDIKTGRSPLTFPRMLEMVVNSQRMYKGQIRNFIVTEVRPTQ
jgi:hypothetical protein